MIITSSCRRDLNSHKFRFRLGLGQNDGQTSWAIQQTAKDVDDLQISKVRAS